MTVYSRHSPERLRETAWLFGYQRQMLGASIEEIVKDDVHDYHRIRGFRAAEREAQKHSYKEVAMSEQVAGLTKDIPPSAMHVPPSATRTNGATKPVAIKQYSVAEYAKHVNLSKSTVRKLCKAGKLNAQQRLNRRWVIFETAPSEIEVKADAELPVDIPAGAEKPEMLSGGITRTMAMPGHNETQIIKGLIKAHKKELPIRIARSKTRNHWNFSEYFFITKIYWDEKNQPIREAEFFTPMIPKRTFLCRGVQAFQVIVDG